METDSVSDDTFPEKANSECDTSGDDMVHIKVDEDDLSDASSNSVTENGEENETQPSDNSAEPCVTNFSISEILRPSFGKKRNASDNIEIKPTYTVDRTDTIDKDKTILKRTSDAKEHEHNQSLLFDFRCFRYAGFHGLSAFSKVCMSKTRPASGTTKHSKEIHVRTSKQSSVSKERQFQIHSKPQRDIQTVLDKSVFKRDSDQKTATDRDVTSPSAVTSSGSPEPGPKVPSLWPAWVYCTRYSDRPSSGPRSRKIARRDKRPDEKRPRTAFTNEQLQRLRSEFDVSRYLTEQRRRELAVTLNLSEAQIKIWYQNKRAKIKKSSGGVLSPLAVHLSAQGLYNHKTSCISETRRDC